MTFAAGFVSGFWTGAFAGFILFVISWAAWYHRDKLIWGRVRAAEKAAPPHEAVIVVGHFGARL